VAEKRPTILQIIPELDTGGAELSTIEIADAVHSAGGHCIVLTEGGRLVQRLRDTGAEVQFFPAAVKSPLRLLWKPALHAGFCAFRVPLYEPAVADGGGLARTGVPLCWRCHSQAHAQAGYCASDVAGERGDRSAGDQPPQ